MNIGIEYDGAYPNLCSGKLVVTINGKRWEFPAHSLRSGGMVGFIRNGHSHVEEGDWNVREWPEGFPEESKAGVLSKINEEIPHGCCGGCL